QAIKIHATQQPSHRAAPNKVAPTRQVSGSMLVQRAMDPRAPLSPADVKTLQRMVGNRELQKLLAQRSQAASTSSAHPIQTKFTVTPRIQRMQPLDADLRYQGDELELNGVKGRVWWVRTNAGTRVAVWVPPGTADANHSHFCHGHALNTYAQFGYT